MTVTSEFDANPLVWMMTHRYVTPVASYVGAPGAFQTGDGAYYFEDAGAGNGGYMLRKAGWTTLIDYVNAFFLAAVPNQANNAMLTNTSNRFLTADLSGCQFLAYGPDRNNLTVEHNNYFNGGPVTYAGRHAAIAGAGYAIFISLQPSAVPTTNANEYYIIEGANVIGVRLADGWHFHVRKRTDRAFGPTNEL